MNTINLSDRMRGRAMATVACAALVLPMAAARPTLVLPQVNTASGLIVGAPRQGMTTKKKVVLLVGAAALYYLYRRHQNAKTQGTAAPQTGQPIYYLSKNGRVYYRDATARVHWVTPPPQGISVPADEAVAYRGLQGYGRSQTGETDLTRFAARNGGM